MNAKSRLKPGDIVIFRDESKAIVQMNGVLMLDSERYGVFELDEYNSNLIYEGECYKNPELDIMSVIPYNSSWLNIQRGSIWKMIKELFSRRCE